MKLADLSSASFFENPYPLYDTLRAEGKLVPVGPNALMSGHYDIVDKLLHDRRMGKNFVEGIRVRYGDEGPQEPVFQGMSRMMLVLNPPMHTRLHALTMKAFNARQLEMMRDVAYGTANRLIDAFRSRETADLVSAYALQIPVEIICRLLNVPVEHAGKLAEAAAGVVAALDAAPMNASALAKANAAIATLQQYFTGVIEKRRERLGDDLISRLLSVEENGETLTDEEIVQNVILLFIAGHETTSNMLGNALIALHRHPEQLQMLKSDPSKIPNAVLECLRYDGSVQMTIRSALDDIEIDGSVVPRGTTVFCALGAANRDPSKFRQPDRLDIDRGDGRLLTFGAGIHHCVGYRLALLELEAALGTLLERLPNLKLTNLDDLHWHPRGNLRGVESLIATW
ncbi:MAG TPA: cytochrome P450 [Paraburkholderia sp.]|jgi:hypothetical protein